MGTGMVASSNRATFRTHRLLHASRHGLIAPVYNDYLREAAASTCLALILGRIASGVPWFLHSTVVPMQLPCQSSHSDVGRRRALNTYPTKLIDLNFHLLKITHICLILAQILANKNVSLSQTQKFTSVGNVCEREVACLLSDCHDPNFISWV